MTAYKLCNTAGTKEHGDLILHLLEDCEAKTKRETVEEADGDYPKLTYTFDNGTEESVVGTLAIMKSMGKQLECYPAD